MEKVEGDSVTAPAIQEDPTLRLQYYKETGQLDMAAKYEAYLKETGQLAPPQKASGATGTWGDEPKPGLAAHVLNIGQGIPGVEALEAGAGALGNGISYEESLKRLREITGGIGGKTRAAEHFVGSLATLPFLPGSAVKAGMALGGADQALSADPMSVGERAGRTAGGAAVGGVAGKAAESLWTGLRSMFAKSPAKNMMARVANRSATADVNYDKALTEGIGKPATPEVQAFLAQPDIAEIVTELQSTRPFKGVAANDPKMLDAIYKTLSDRASQVKKGLESVSPTKPNIGRFRGQDIKAAQTEALDAMDGPMPSYREAVKTYAAQSSDIEALAKGIEIIKTIKGGKSPAVKQLVKKSPQAFAKWAEHASPSQKKAAMEGILGELGETPRVAFGRVLGTPLIPYPTRALRDAPGLLRLVDPNADRAAKLGLLSLYSP